MFRRKILLFLMLAMAACKKVDIAFGDQFLDNGYTQIVKVDSFSAELSTVFIDSFISSGKGVILTGGYTDPVFGRITTQSFFELAPPNYSDSYADAIFDSLTLMLHLTKNYYGDSSRNMHLDVHRLSQPITTAADGSGIYNNRQFAVEPAPLGSVDLTIRPNLTDTISIRLSDVLGKMLLKKLQAAGDVDITNTEGFLQYFHGLRISAAAGGAMVLGCSDSVSMRLHYSKAGLYLGHGRADFTLTNQAHQFNYISADRSATVLRNLGTGNNEIPAGLTNNTAYSQYASGVMTKIRFPSLRDILKLPDYTKILKAILIIRPVQQSYNSVYFLPPALRLSSTTRLNQIGGDLAYVTSKGTSAAQTGNLSVDYLYGENTFYTYDVTAYLKEVIGNTMDNRNGLLLIPPSPALETQFSRVIIGDRNNLSGKLEMQIYYAAVR